MIKIVFVSFPLVAGGPQSWLVDLVKAMDKERFSITVLSFVYDQAEKNRGEWILEREIIAAGAVLHVVSFPNSGAGRVLRVYRSLREIGAIDLIHSNTDLTDAIFLAAAWLRRIPVRIAHIRNARFSDNPKSLKARFLKGVCAAAIRRFATHIFAVSQVCGIELFGQNVVSKNFSVVPSAINPERLLTVASTRERSRERLRLGHVGRFTKQKNHEFLLKVLAEFVRRKIRVELVLVGAGPRKEEIESLGAAMGLGHCISIIAPVVNVAEVMSRFDVMVFPSLWEGTPRVVVEAQLCGVPVICSEAVPEVSCVTPRLFQRLSLSEDLSVWTDVVLEYSSQSLSAAEIRKAFADSPLSIENQARNLSEFYSKALEPI